jgi:hypothetical protein
VRDVGCLGEWEGGRKAGKGCYRDCDFPSQCLNEGSGEREKRIGGRCGVERDSSTESTETESESETEGVIEEKGDGKMDCGEEEKEMSLEVDKEQGLDISESERETESEDANLGPMGIDCDGLGEESKQACYMSCRRNSFDATGEGELVPKSPLKECAFGFGFEDVELACAHAGWGMEGYVDMADVEEKEKGV